MLNLINKRVRVAALAAVTVIATGASAVTAHAQGFCHQELMSQVMHPTGHPMTVYGPYGPYTIMVPCAHVFTRWITFCD